MIRHAGVDDVDALVFRAITEDRWLPAYFFAIIVSYGRFRYHIPDETFFQHHVIVGMHKVAGIGHDLLSCPGGIVLRLHVEETINAVERVADGYGLQLALELSKDHHIVTVLVIVLLGFPQAEQGIALAVQIHESHLLIAFSTRLHPFAVAKALILKVLHLDF